MHAFGTDTPIHVSRQTLAHIIEARTEEIFYMVLQEIKRSGYDGLLPAGMVLTGGTSMLPGIQDLANNVMNMPVRIAQPENLYGLVDQLKSPSFSSSVGLLHWAMLYLEAENNRQGKATTKGRGNERQFSSVIDFIKEIFKQLLP